LDREKESKNDDEFKKVEPFVKVVKKCSRDGIEKFNLTLGQMNWLLNLATGETTVTVSPLLQDFRDFISSDEHKAIKINKLVLTDLNFQVIIELRNLCAHPNKLERDNAEKCKNTVPPVIDRFEGYD